MSEAATEWWIKVKAPTPGADYRWLCLSPAGGPTASAALPAEESPELPSAALRAAIAAAAQVGGTGELTIVLLVGADGAPVLYIEGLHAPSWPADHQGRTITASVVGRAAAAGVGQAEPLARALWAFTHPTAARQAALERVVRFGTGEPGTDPAAAGGSGVPAGAAGPAGVRVDAAAWRLFLRTVNRLPTPHPVDLGAGRRGSGQVALDDAVRDAVSALLGGSLGYPLTPPPRLLLAVSPLLDDEWCDRHRPWRAVGVVLGGHGRAGTPAERPPPAHSRLTNGAAGTARPAPPARFGRAALPGRAQAVRLVKSVFSVLALAALCAAVVLVVL